MAHEAAVSTTSPRFGSAVTATIRRISMLDGSYRGFSGRANSMAATGNFGTEPK
jgi:hypothetical protein